MRLASAQEVSTQLSYSCLLVSSQRKPPAANHKHFRCEHNVSYHTFQNCVKHGAERRKNLKIGWKHVLKFAFLPSPAFLGLFLALHWFRIHYVICVRVRSYAYITMQFSIPNVQYSPKKLIAAVLKKCKGVALVGACCLDASMNDMAL